MDHAEWIVIARWRTWCKTGSSKLPIIQKQPCGTRCLSARPAICCYPVVGQQRQQVLKRFLSTGFSALLFFSGVNAADQQAGPPEGSEPSSPFQISVSL